MKLTILIFMLFGTMGVYAQNVGIGNADPKAKLDISGDLILKSADLTLADGNTLALDVNTNKYNHYKLIGPTGNFQIGGIGAGEHDRIITLYNRTGHSLEVYNDDVNADVANRILTGTGGTFAVYSGGSVTMKYDNTINKWELTASHYNSLDNFGSGNVLPITTIILSEAEQNTNLLSENFTLYGALQLPVTSSNSEAYNWFFQPVTYNAPSLRGEHTAIWDGNRMIVWGGYDLNSNSYLNDGKIYDPSNDVWQSISNSAIEERSFHSAVWTGLEMIIWGGINESYTFGNGSMYNPTSNTWQSMSSTNGPSSRFSHTAIWTGQEMIIWGGTLAGTLVRTDHKRYNPVNDSWSNITNVNSPSARVNHSAIWTGDRMIIFGGKLSNGTITNTGGIYDPATDSWSTISTLNGPPNGLSEHTAIWTGTEMITFGGRKNGGGLENNFYKYNPIDDTWVQGNNTNKPISTIYHTAIWTGDKMIVYGGPDEIAGIYDPSINSWENQNIVNNLNFVKHTAIWTGNAMIVSGTDNTQILKKGFISPKNKVMYLYKKM